MPHVIVTNSAAHAAHSLCPRDFLENPCGGCNHGAGQHLGNPDLKPPYTRNYKRGMGACTVPGCECTSFELGQQFYGS